MELTTNTEELQQAADFRLTRRILRPDGASSIVFGAIAIRLGASWMKDNPTNLIVIVIGIWLLLGGIGALIAPSPRSMLVQGTGLVAVGLWNIITPVYNAVYAGWQLFGGIGGWLLILGGWQITWGGRMFTRYKRFSGKLLNRPSEESLRWVDQTLKAIGKTSAASSSDVLQFVMVDTGRRWKGQLMKDIAVFLEEDLSVLVVRREDTTFTQLSKASPDSPTLEASVQIGEQHGTALMSPEMLSRYQEWKLHAIQ